MSTIEQPTRQRPGWVLARHYVEMVLAMGVGMMTLYPLWQLAVDGRPAGSWMHLTETDSLVMATTMVITMALWMRFRGHRDVVAMSAAMYAGFVVLFPFLWIGVLDPGGVVGLGHVLMLVFMLGVMLVRHRRH